MESVGTIIFGGHVLNVYRDLDKPLFQAVEVAKLIDYSIGNTSHMLDVVEQDEKILMSTRNDDTGARGNAANMWYITELGLYNVLSQSRKPIARGWRRIVHEELIRLRQSRGKDIVEQFDDWNHELDTIFIDPETGIMMQSVTVQGGDVDIIPYE